MPIDNSTCFLRAVRIGFGAFLAALLPCAGQTVLTLERAEQMALDNHPRIQSAALVARASRESINQARSGLLPNVVANVTAAEANKGTSIAAGNITTSSLVSRLAGGVSVSQLLTDFGRTSALIHSLDLRAQAQESNAQLTRSQIRLQVRQAYYRALLATAVERSAQQLVSARQLTLRQISALAQSNLKSTLDVSFAEVNVSEAELALFRTQNDISGSMAQLAAAIGSELPPDTKLSETTGAQVLTVTEQEAVQNAIRERPDAAALRLQRDSARSFAESERRLKYPTFSALGTAGVVPTFVERLRWNWAAVGVNLSIPIFNGKLYESRAAEAALRASAADKDLQDLQLRITRDVKLAWLNAEYALKNLAVTARFVEQSRKTMRLAQARYDIGLGSIVELNQAQLSQTSAEISAASASFEFAIRQTMLEYETGVLK